MSGNYEKIIRENLRRLFQKPADRWAAQLPGEASDSGVRFRAFGGECLLAAENIVLDGEVLTGPLGIVISLYALQANPAETVLEPFRSFKDFPDTAPYHAAFAGHAEKVLVPHVHDIASNVDPLCRILDGGAAPSSLGGDIVFTVRPFPKIVLCYIFYEADEEFPASATCLFSNNADRFLPIDALADTGEYMSRKIIERVGG